MIGIDSIIVGDITTFGQSELEENFHTGVILYNILTFNLGSSKEISGDFALSKLKRNI